MQRKNLKTCKKGHQFFKSNDCPVCPVCEQERNPKECPFLLLSAPAIRALENKAFKTLKQLSKYIEDEILSLHGMGLSALPILRKTLSSEQLSFKKN